MAAARSEVAKSLDLEILRYSKVWEDHRVLEEALDIGNEDTVLSITSSGDNTLNLLLKEPKAVIAVDMSVAQNSLLELKLAAIKHLKYSEFVKLIGAMDASEEERMSLYDSIRERLPRYAEKYLDQHKDFIASGISHCGRLDQYLGKFVAEKVPTVISSDELDRFFSASSLEEQAALFKSWPEDRVQELIRDATSRANQSSKARSEAQLKHVTLNDEEIFHLFWRRFSYVCLNVSTSDNFYLSWYLQGASHYNLAERQDFCPPYLRAESFQKLKALVNRVTVVCSTLEDYLVQPNASFTKANLTDLFEYMDEEAMEKLYRLLVSQCHTGGRLAYWNLFCRRHCPSSLKDRVQPLSDLAASLHSKDRVFFYSSFQVDEILP